MAKLSKDDKRQIVIQYVAGATCRELAQKYNVSASAISKILNEEKSKQKLTEVDNIVNAENTSNQKKAHGVIDTIINGLEKDLQKASLKDKRELLKTLVELFGLPEHEEDERVEKISVEFEDASEGEDDTNS
jgi:transposase-like protein